MSDVTRRGFIGSAATPPVCSRSVPPRRRRAFPSRTTCPTHCSGKELPTFKFALEKSEGHTMDGSYGKEATVLQLPISKGIAGVSMRLEPA